MFKCQMNCIDRATHLTRMHELKLARVSAAMRAGIEIKNRYYLLKQHENCFLGREAIDWMLSNGQARNREEGVFLGQLMMDYGFFRHPVDAHRFKDDKIFYRFKEDEKGAQGSGPAVAALVAQRKILKAGLLWKKGLLKWGQRYTVIAPDHHAIFVYDNQTVRRDSSTSHHSCIRSHED